MCYVTVKRSFDDLYFWSLCSPVCVMFDIMIREDGHYGIKYTTSGKHRRHARFSVEVWLKVHVLRLEVFQTNHASCSGSASIQLPFCHYCNPELNIYECGNHLIGHSIMVAMLKQSGQEVIQIYWARNRQRPHKSGYGFDIL